MYDDEFELTFDLSDEDEESRPLSRNRSRCRKLRRNRLRKRNRRWRLYRNRRPLRQWALRADLGRRPGHRSRGGPRLLAGGLPGGGALPHPRRGGGGAGKGAAGPAGGPVRRGSRASCEVAFHTVEQAVGHVDVLVSNAGIAQQKLFTDITPEEWQHMLDVNLSGAFHLCQLALPGMIRRKAGRILTVSSMWGQTGGSCEVHYSAAKRA